VTDDLDDLLSGPDEGLPEPAGLADNGDAARRVATDGEEAHHESGELAAEGVEPDAPETAAEMPASETESSQPDTEEAAKPTKSRAPRPPIEDFSEERKPIKKEWYILKVQSNREDSIADALQRRIAIADLGEYFDEIIVPTEKVSEFKGGKKRVVKRKIYPGYIVVHMELNDDTWFLVRETPGIGDFTGSGGKPTPMLPHEVNKIVAKQEEKAEQEIRTVIPFAQGDRVRINEGTFENFEGDVDNIDQANGRVTIMINIFGRSTPVELEYWQVEKL
jgi:transcriptional antiterminator NusG